MLFELFDNLSFDLRDKICSQVTIIKETEKNKRYFTGVILNELNYNIKNNDDIKDTLTSCFEYFGIGERDTDEYIIEDGGGIIETLHDEIYYNDLDFILMCHKSVFVDTTQGEISFHYKIKDIYKQSAKSYLNEEKNRLPNINNEIIFDDDYRFHYNSTAMYHDLYDFCNHDIFIDYKTPVEYEEQLENCIINNFTNISDVELHILLDKCTKGKTAFMDHIP